MCAIFIIQTKTDTYIADLKRINYQTLSDVHKADYDIFNDTLQTYVRGYAWKE